MSRVLDIGRHRRAGNQSSPNRGGYDAADVRAIPCDAAGPISHYAAWMSGWFNQKHGYTYINLEAYARNVENVKAWCATNPGELVMTGLERATVK